MKKKILIGAIVLIAIISVAIFRHGRGGDGDQPIVLKAKVEEGPLLISVRASGEIRSKTSSKVIPGIKRSENVEFLVPEGSHVTNGQTVAKISTDDISRRILDAELKVADADTKLLAAKTDYEIQIIDNATAMTTAVQAVQSADLTLKEFQEGNMPMQVKTAELKVATTASEYARNTKKFAESQQILKQGFITEDQLEEDRIKLETARVDKETSVDELNILKMYTLPLKQSDVRNARMKAYSDLEKTKKKNDVQLEMKLQAREQAVAILQKATNDLNQLREEFQAYDVKSISAGIVTYGDADASWRRAEVQVGMTLMPGEVLMTIPDMSALQAVVDVPEADIPKVKEGQRATINIEAVANKTFKGKVDRVAEIANPGGFLESAVKQFKVNIALEQTTEMRPGFSCDVEILIETMPKVLKVPVQAVFNENGDFVAYVDSTLGPVRTQVRIGKSSITHVEILSGLKKGESVLLSKPGAKKTGDAEGKENVIRLEKVSRTYITGGGVTVLRDVSLHVKRGEAACIIGPSGSGKSTMLNILGLLDRPSMGKFYFEGIDTATLDDAALSHLRGRRIGFVFQSFHLISHLTVAENVELPLFYQRVPPAERRRRAAEKLAQVGLSHRLHHKPNQLSGGECQRTAVARALVTDTELLLADEPTGNLDQKTGAEILALFDKLSTTGKTLLVITHDMSVAARFARRIHIADGIVSEGTP